MEVYFLLFYYFRYFHFFQNQLITQNLVVYFGGFGGVLWNLPFSLPSRPLTISPSHLATPSPLRHPHLAISSLGGVFWGF